MSLGLAFKTFFKVLGDRTFAEKVKGLALPAPKIDPEVERARLVGEQLRLLSILQRDGRLLDFLSEDLGTTPTRRSAARCETFIATARKHSPSMSLSNQWSKRRRRRRSMSPSVSIHPAFVWSAK